MQADDATQGEVVADNGTSPIVVEGVVPAVPDSEEQPQKKGKPRARQHGHLRPADGEDTTNRKLLNLPPVVGSCLQYLNKSVPYRPFPPDVDVIRKKVFLMENPLLLDSQQIADYWPHVSNLYMRSSRPSTHVNGIVSEAWECRIRRRVTMKGKDKSGTGIRQRQSKDEMLGDVGECKVRLILTSYTKHVESQEACGGPGFGNCHCLAEWLYVARTNHTADIREHHTHSLDLLDMYKRSDAIMYFCKVKVEEGQYSYAAVLRWVKEKYGPITSQLQHLNKADVANVARPWRLLNKDVELRAEIVEETDEHRQRTECLDSIQSTSAEQLRKALVEVCKVYPQAVNIISPFMEKPPDSQDRSKPIVEGPDIILPFPGRSRKRRMPCDPPSPGTPSNGPPGPTQPVVQGVQAPLQLSQSYPQASSNPPNNVVQGFRISLPAPTPMPATSRNSQNGFYPSPALVPTPYQAPAAPRQFLQYPLPSAPQSSAARIMAQTNGIRQVSMNGHRQDRPSWAQPAAKKPGSPPASSSAARPSGSVASAMPAVREPEPEVDMEQQLRDELSR